MIAAVWRNTRLLAPAALLLGFGLFWFADTVADPDLWGHIRFGQDIIRTRSIVQIDPYSYRTGHQPWINHEWLSETILAALYDTGGAGPFGLIGFKVFLSVLILGLAYRHLLRCGVGPWVAVVVLAVASIPFRLGLGTVRPQMFTYFFYFVTLRLLDRAESKSDRWLWPLPLVFAVWINLHGGALAGIGVVGIAIAVRIAVYALDLPGGRDRGLGSVVHLALIGLLCAGRS